MNFTVSYFESHSFNPPIDKNIQVGHRNKSWDSKSRRGKSLPSAGGRNPQCEGSGRRRDVNWKPRARMSNGSINPAQAQHVAMDNEPQVFFFFLGYKIKSMSNCILGKGAWSTRVEAALGLQSRRKHTDRTGSSYPAT